MSVYDKNFYNFVLSGFRHENYFKQNYCKSIQKVKKADPLTPQPKGLSEYDFG